MHTSPNVETGPRQEKVNWFKIKGINRIISKFQNCDSFTFTEEVDQQVEEAQEKLTKFNFRLLSGPKPHFVKRMWVLWWKVLNSAKRSDVPFTDYVLRYHIFLIPVVHAVAVRRRPRRGGLGRWRSGDSFSSSWTPWSSSSWSWRTSFSSSPWRPKINLSKYM